MKHKTLDNSTEEKIKEAARVVFTKKGFEAAKVRDIAAEANLNLSLVNYYFRSKENLFRIIMVEKMQILFGGLEGTLNNEHLSFIQKIEHMVTYYINHLTNEPNFPFFVVSEILSNPEQINKIGFREILLQSHFVKQLMEMRVDNKLPFSPIHIFPNIIGMVIAPYLLRPGVLNSKMLSEGDFNGLMEERKKLIPMWIYKMLQA